MEVLGVALRLGLTSFGGPIAHLGYYRDAYVVRRRWLDEATYADLVALGQFLPGPASTQVGVAIGILRAGLAGGLAAWIGFTLPSALAMVALGLAAGTGGDWPGLVAGLKLAAVAVVAAAVIAMGRALAPDPPRLLLAALAAAAALALPVAATQVAIIAVAAVVGLVAFRHLIPAVRPGSADDDPGATEVPGAVVAVPRVVAVGAFGLYTALLGGLALLATGGAGPLVELAWACYRAGALVFGGGHVVLPLLETSIVGPGLVGEDAFLAGYGAAQALPGPLFAFAAYLGAVAAPGGLPVVGAAVALVAIFLPGLLLVVAALPAWAGLRARPGARAALAGVNAAVVGILLAALWDPVARTAIRGPLDVALAAAGTLALLTGRVPPIVVVAALAAAGIVSSPT
jgi:chromate transporter